MKLMVIDGNSILNRAYYGIRPLTTRDGLYTHAIFGFLTTLLRLEGEQVYYSLSAVDNPIAVLLNVGDSVTIQHNAPAEGEEAAEGFRRPAEVQLYPGFERGAREAGQGRAFGQRRGALRAEGVRAPRPLGAEGLRRGAEVRAPGAGRRWRRTAFRAEGEELRRRGASL